MNKLFEQMNHLLQKQNDEEFEFFVSNHQELLKEDPVLFISNHVSYYAYKEDINKVLEVINYYKNQPYISMTVEDLLNELKEEVEKLKISPKSMSKADIIKNLKSNNEERIASSLDALSKLNIRSYIHEVEEFLLSGIKYKYKTLALFILIEQKYEKDIKLMKNGLIYTINPSYLELPFETYEYQECKRLLEEEDIDPQIKNNAIEIMNICQIKEFPDSYLTLDNCLLMKDIFIALAKKYLLINDEIDSLVSKHKISKAKIEELMTELSKIVCE